MKAKLDISNILKLEATSKYYSTKIKERLPLLKGIYDEFYNDESFILDLKTESIYAIVDLDVILNIGDKILYWDDFIIEDKFFDIKNNMFVYLLKDLN